MFYNGYDSEQRGARISRDRLLQDEQVAALWPPRQEDECELSGFPVCCAWSFGCSLQIES